MSQQNGNQGELQTLESQLPAQHDSSNLKALVQDEVLKLAHRSQLLSLRHAESSPTLIANSAAASDIVAAIKADIT
jgi:hypothetical protein